MKEPFSWLFIMLSLHSTYYSIRVCVFVSGMPVCMVGMPEPELRELSVSSWYVLKLLLVFVVIVYWLVIE